MTTIEKLRIITHDNNTNISDLIDILEMAVDLEDVVIAIDDFYEANYEDK